jgi:hypothetical protein
LVRNGGARLQSQHSRGRGRQISEFEASMVYKVSSRTARAIQRNPVSKNKTKKKKKRKRKRKERNDIFQFLKGNVVCHLSDMSLLATRTVFSHHCSKVFHWPVLENYLANFFFSTYMIFSDIFLARRVIQ